MTEKQEKILTTALRLFAEQGFEGTSTKQIAKESGVSEGLIFKHFHNKEGLLDAVMNIGHDKAEALFKQITSLKTPKAILKACLGLAFQIPEEDYPFWRLIYALKWNSGIDKHNQDQPLIHILSTAFHQLGYDNPLAEAELVQTIIQGLSSSILLGKTTRLTEVHQVLLAKYNLVDTTL